tara:strand:+ start:138 stop:656 length:519 start_codon:yes stop_codon:yes gene_type:complete
MKIKDCFYIGTVVAKYSYKGELLVKTDSDNPEQYLNIESFFVNLDTGLIPFFVKNCYLHKSELLRIKFENVSNEDQAISLLKKDIYLPLKFLPPLEGKKFYFHEVLGFDVKENNQIIGSILRIQENNAQALFEIEKKDRSISMIPVHDDFIIEVNRVERYIRVKIPEGLLDL